MRSLEEKINKSREIIKLALERWSPDEIVFAWKGGKDSTVILDIIRKTYKGKIPFRLLFNDSTIEFPEVYDFIDKMEKRWHLDLIRVRHLPEDLKAYRQAKSQEEGMRIMRLAKIHAIEYAVAHYHIKAIISGIRWDEHRARAHEKYFSPRKTHVRIHPALHFTLDDIWEYIHQYNVPYVKLYDRGYKSLGEAPFTSPVRNSDPERKGREKTKEKVMNRLRNLGYW